MACSTGRWGLWGRRLGWLVLIWAASVASLGVVAFALRLIMKAGGLTLS